MQYFISLTRGTPDLLKNFVVGDPIGHLLTQSEDKIHLGAFAVQTTLLAQRSHFLYLLYKSISKSVFMLSIFCQCQNIYIRNYFTFFELTFRLRSSSARRSSVTCMSSPSLDIWSSTSVVILGACSLSCSVFRTTVDCLVCGPIHGAQLW